MIVIFMILAIIGYISGSCFLFLDYLDIKYMRLYHKFRYSNIQDILFYIVMGSSIPCLIIAIIQIIINCF